MVYTIQKGMSQSTIARDLQNQGIITSNWVFGAYALLTGKYKSLQAGSYYVSPSMSVAGIVDAFSSGKAITNKLTIIPGWDIGDLLQYLDKKGWYSKKDLTQVLASDFAQRFSVLKNRPKRATLEGYLFPDTYQISPGQTPQMLVTGILANFDKKLTPDLRQEIARQKKSVYQIITMASILEKEVKTPEDKKIVAGILWKRIANGMPLQTDSTINYITGKSNRSSLIKDTAIDSPYNTYKYAGLPAGPICNPGMDSILAAIYPQKSAYWYYLSADGSGKTIFSKTLEEHNTAIAKYLKS